MTSAALVRPENFQIGRVFNNTFSVIGRNIVLCVGLAALFSGLPQLVTQLMPQLVTQHVGLNSHTGNPANFAAAITNHKLGFIIGTAVIVILYLAFAVLLQSSLVRVAIEDMNGKKPTFGDSIATAIRFLLPTVAIGLLVALGVGAASIALLVPGIILGLGWSVAIPVLIQERLGVFGSMSRSRALAKGSRWALFGLFVILVIMGLVMQSITGVVVYLFHGIVAAVVAAMVQSIGSMVGSVAAAVSYVELRQVKEGTGVDELAEIFS
ncbi:hypothetical protein EOA79_01335 [Mesorhizobium sp. M1A.F.Ca.IN.020.03.2.1]|uniref:hypothetical protein n=2 Tax=Mesorhizobium TaxID=68287 RepID=UPI000FCB5F36|nr:MULTISPECIES: hypothetical protein [unclassified Mesorhizobium]RUV08142.1 hypothetical protein EOA79_01335 [Mesorhizobium sp. M1A.F.Ca.IN.020.03.2.1]RUV89171.1 hypothetical protein EOA51_04455 [Mesorhizobium sp. M1A.F.Ca.IN.020.32.1.1]RUW11946.1 hypothetical protein EOA46_10845 [Mesorhizobium sp. M1A.F.Ca.IN.022.05.2.1]RWF81970.1 MAG: hypothetical protein EOQ35_12050 [Mesorhizobium sp.]RWF96377.1 MAG: hypothetical protein EOQ38_25560 [Mesorhizobium sp.]